MDQLHSFATSSLTPDRTYLIDVSPSTAALRRARRAQDRMETEGKAFYDRVRDEYMRMAANHSTRTVVLDGSESRTELAFHIERDALERLS